MKKLQDGENDCFLNGAAIRIHIKTHWTIYLLLLLLLLACLLTIIIAASEQDHMRKAKMWSIEKRKSNME